MKKMFLICNAHLDPIWQWEWPEGAAAAVSTFRVAASLCEEYGCFVFNHNEMLLYEWVEEYEPELFARIQRLAREGRWRIIGGWYLQPDCLMPSGESFLRQMLTGRRYFLEKFGQAPRTAVNFDSFGHTRSLTQLMKKSGYDRYVFMRPDQSQLELPGVTFIWRGQDGSEIIAHRLDGPYNTPLGHAHECIDRYIKAHSDMERGLVAWGVGNHGGGPSREDVAAVNALIAAYRDQGCRVAHSSLDDYFDDMSQQELDALPRYEGDLVPVNVGCYTSMIRIKQKHRRLENGLFTAEKMASAACAAGLMVYPAQALQDAAKDLMLSEFHDVLPGSSIQEGEEGALRVLDKGYETVSRVMTRALFALTGGQAPARQGEIPIIVFNPHPFPVTRTVECEFMLADQNWKKEFTLPVVMKDGVPIPSQPEKEASNLNLDWRKRVSFTAELAPMSMSRFDCCLQTVPEKPKPRLERDAAGNAVFDNGEMRLIINGSTGCVDSYRVGGVEQVKPGAFRLDIVEDIPDPWFMRACAFPRGGKPFRLADPETGSWLSGLEGCGLESIRAIEDGPVRTVIEVVLCCAHSYAVMTYYLPKQGTAFELKVRVFWNEKQRLLKLCVSPAGGIARYRGQTAYGVSELAPDGREMASGKWVMVDDGNQALTVINDSIHGSDAMNGGLRLSLLRSSGYCVHPIEDRPLVPEDRFLPRSEQGERIFRFEIQGGSLQDRLLRVEQEAASFAEAPVAMSFFPSGGGTAPGRLVETEGNVILGALKAAEDGAGYIARLYHPSQKAGWVRVRCPLWGREASLEFAPYEVKTLRLGDKGIEETDAMEGLLGSGR